MVFLLGLQAGSPGRALADGTGAELGAGPYLTAPSSEAAGVIVRGYLRGHSAEQGLGQAEIGDLSVARNYPTRDGDHRLILQQEVGGLPVLGQEVVANVTGAGRLMNVFTSSPGPSSVAAVPERVGSPVVDADEALEAAKAAVDPDPGDTDSAQPTFRDGQAAELVLRPTIDSLEEEWRTLARSPEGRVYEVLVDATSGEPTSRRDLTDDAVKADVFDYYPGAPIGGEYVTRDITPYVSHPGSSVLEGENAEAFSALEDNDIVQDVAPSDAAGDYEFPYYYFNLGASGNCPPAPYYCSWDTETPESWALNQDRAVVQLFYQVNRYHDHLAEAPIDFTAAKGAYEGANRILAQANVGADTGTGQAEGLPDEGHLNNGFFSPDPGGNSSIIMYLFGPDTYLHGAGAILPNAPTVNVADDGSFVFHEYTHGLSDALLSDAQGVSTLESPQATAMSEGWSDWYAMDFVVGEGYEVDTAAPGEIEWGRYTGGGRGTNRPQPIDCPVGAAAGPCPAVGEAGSGGFTYGDMGRIESTPEAHADGTIWSQTLWDLRQRLIAAHGAVDGDGRARLLVTAGMELSPPDPSFLDERNAILDADALYDGGEDEALIWSVFATRGMGYFASTTGPFDAHPIEDFSMPPAGSASGDVGGVVTTQDGAPVAGATVAIGGFAQTLKAVTDAQGHYLIAGIPVGVYHQLVVTSPLPGFDDEVATEVPVASGATTERNVTLQRDWASVTGGAVPVAEVGPSSEAGCPAAAALDQDFGTGWATYSPADPEHPGPKSFTVRLSDPIDISSVAIEPSAFGCFFEAAASASLGGYRVEVSSDGVNFSLAAQGTFIGSNVGRRNVLPVSSPDPVDYVRLVGDSTLNSHPGFGGASELSVSELQVYGNAVGSEQPATPPSGGASPGATSTSANSPAPAPSASAPAKAPRCKKGFRKKKVGKKTHCVKVAKHHRHKHLKHAGRKHGGD